MRKLWENTKLLLTSIFMLSHKVFKSDQGPTSPTIPKKVLALFLQFFQYLKTFESKTFLIG